MVISGQDHIQLNLLFVFAVEHGIIWIFNLEITTKVKYILRGQRGSPMERGNKNIALWTDEGETRTGTLNRRREGRKG